MNEKLFSILRYHTIDRILNEKGRANTKDLLVAVAELNLDFELNEQMIENDIKDMKSDPVLGYFAPIAYNKSENLYSYSDTNYSIQKHGLNKFEKEALLMIMHYFDYIKEHKNMHGLRGMIQKLVDTLRIRHNTDDFDSPEFVDSELSPDFGGSKFLGPLMEAIKTRRVVRLYYHPFYEDKPYFTIIHPYLIKEFKGRWYLIGLNDTKREIRTYGLDRIWELEETADTYIPKTFKASDYFKNTVGIISPLGNPPEIQIEVSKHQAQYLITQPLHGSQYIESENEEYVIFSYKVHPTYEFKALILAMGKDVRVLKPESFKKTLLHELNEAILAYGRRA
ncbi:MAG: WYL domain-containing protein [Bacteroidales bacterium]|nr:WYL domain-containing protein [Bacteroidales bacterium]MCF8391969.1 WYL domain-containing protein [Bacteroidales bacterium]